MNGCEVKNLTLYISEAERRRKGGSPSSPQGSYSVDSVNFNSESVKVIIDQGGNI